MLAPLKKLPTKWVLAGLFGMTVLAVGVALVRSGDEPAPAAPSPSAAAPTTTTTTAPLQIAPLTGLAGEFGDRIDLPAVFVKIDNALQARPQSGLVQADLVFEEQVEGSASRLAAVFHSTDAMEVGPVRSTRSTDLTLVSLFGRPIYASSGGNGDILRKLAAADVIDVGHNVSGEGFRRLRGHAAPHNLFTTLAELYSKSPEQPPAPAPLFTYREPGEALSLSARPAGGVAVSFGAAESSRFIWDAPSKQWFRYNGDQPHMDAAGRQIAPRNVIVLETRYDYSGANGNSRPHGELTGEGRALVFTDGKVIEGRWARPSTGALRLLTANGDPIKLTPGQTFIELPRPDHVQIL